ncbi:hypothetical protein Q5P01_009165 [Channa striata]|uniref:Uncharacterized protein n=1 Tax=Channa striata TaxID=64152 RepID=A0AA88SSB6_CHASR|nr:hypothetical protein Q5P01_009165 [Channa striata]
MQPDLTCGFESGTCAVHVGALLSNSSKARAAQLERRQVCDRATHNREKPWPPLLLLLLLPDLLHPPEAA